MPRRPRSERWTHRFERVQRPVPRASHDERRPLTDGLCEQPTGQQRVGECDEVTPAPLLLGGRIWLDDRCFVVIELCGEATNDARSTGRMLSLRCELRQQEWGEGEDRKERISLLVRKLGLLSLPGTGVLDIDADAA